MIRLTATLVAAAFVILAAGCGQDQPADTAPGAGDAAKGLQRSPAPPGAEVFIITPGNGATVASPVTVKFGISGMAVAPAGDATPGTGHHHLLIDTELADPAVPIPADERHVHFGKGQTETTVELQPGQHTLQLVLGDGNHVPHEPPVMSKVVTITVE